MDIIYITNESEVPMKKTGKVFTKVFLMEASGLLRMYQDATLWKGCGTKQFHK